LAGDAVTGVCAMAVAEGLDTGDVYARVEVPIGDESLDELRARLVERGSAMLVDLLADGPAGLPAPVPQVGEPTYADKIRPAELELDWSRPAAELARLVRLGRAHSAFRGRRLGVLAARDLGPAPAGGQGPPGSLEGTGVRTGDGLLALDRVQPEGRRPMAAADWVRGVRPEPGERLG